MVIKTVTKKTSTTVKKKTKRDPSPSTLLKKVASVSDSNKALQKEIKIMTKIFIENQKVLVSMKGMIDTLTSTLEYIQKQSKQINIIEDDTQKLYAGLNQVRTQSNLVTKINDQTVKLEKEISRISEIQKISKPQEISQQVEDSVNSIKNNSQMIIKIAQRIDEVKDDLRKVSGKTNSFLEISSEINNLRNSIEEISGKTAKIDTGSQIITSLKQEFERITDEMSQTSNLNTELDAIKITIDTIASKASKIDSLGRVIDDLKQEFERITDEMSQTSNLNTELDAIKITIDTIASKASKIDSLGRVIDDLKQEFNIITSKANAVDNQSLESIKHLGGKVDKIETEIKTLVKRADSTAFVGEGLKSMQNEVSNFKQNVFDKTNSIEQKVSLVSETLKKQDESTNELHNKSEKLFEGIQEIKNISNKASNDSSKEMMALLKLSEYQSNIRMNAESKYGVTKDIEKMASQTTDIVNLFDKISMELGEKIPLPNEVRQWAVSKILDCADKWEIRFSDVFSILANSIGKDMLKESIKIQQVRDIYGIRAVDEIRRELNIS